MLPAGSYEISAYVDGNPAGPVVACVSGLGEPGAVWQPVLARIGTRARVVTYDRAGIGGTPARPDPAAPHPYSAFAAELAAVLDGLGIAGPVVLVGHSFGCLVVRAFTARWPGRVAGLVFVESSIPSMDLFPHEVEPRRDGDDDRATVLDTEAGAAELAAERFPPVPAVVLTRTPGRWRAVDGATDEIDRRWRDSHRRLAAQTGGAHLFARDAGHRLIEEATDLVVLALDAVLSADGGPARVSPDQAAAAGGRLA
jgi:pimeloyl-ACP methyl ester carboxylesterase